MVIWTEYLKHRARVRGFDLAIIEQIVQFSEERYFDSATQRMVAVGRHGSRLVMIPYEQEGETVTPITLHATTRQQINLRLRTGRFRP
jgi:RNA:NAD 2'-phosphotransferase (TPT1/KptA family)